MLGRLSVGVGRRRQFGLQASRLALAVTMRLVLQTTVPVLTILLQAAWFCSRSFQFVGFICSCFKEFFRVLISSHLARLSTGTRGDISIEEPSGSSFVVHPHEMVAPTQLQLSQQGVGAEEACLFYHFHIRDPVLSFQLQCLSETVKMEVLEHPRLLLVHRPGLHFIQQP
ncbi:unnamed protein product [Schistocephalus solidus]|uniref:Secreted protein n=1 Tax=Schistocephalus solidus TaxID=70667 RepID=A0A183SU38_SCHSO|nr:unnamed protein product [Schistocephalus solidus]